MSTHVKSQNVGNVNGTNGNINGSDSAHDPRSISRIIYEKAAFGAVPTDFKIDSHSDWHTTQWMHHPELFAVRFSDGSTIFVTNKTSMPAAHLPESPVAEPDPAETEAESWSEETQKRLAAEQERAIDEELDTGFDSTISDAVRSMTGSMSLDKDGNLKRDKE